VRAKAFKPFVIWRGRRFCPKGRPLRKVANGHVGKPARLLAGDSNLFSENYSERK